MDAVAQKYEPSLLSIAAPVYSADQLTQLVDPADTDAAAVINRINSSKVLGPMWISGPTAIENEPLNGFVANLEKGKLGLIPAPA